MGTKGEKELHDSFPLDSCHWFFPLSPCEGPQIPPVMLLPGMAPCRGLAYSFSPMLGVSFMPTALHRIFGWQMEAFASKRLLLTSLLGEEIMQVAHSVRMADGLPARIEQVERFIRQKGCHLEDEPGLVERIIQYIQGEGTDLHVHQLARRLGIHRRRMERLFKRQVGISPKQYIQIHRLQKAVWLYLNSPCLDVQDVVCMCGYFDQAHFIREFKAFTGKTPGQFLNRSPAEKGEEKTSKLMSILNMKF
ncbi:MAG: AraC family transcriptional regulator [Bacteroidetes bacterium]|nr:MAG: AraC family transcriptional regulator [Bacteroidota bacterium]